MYSAEFFPGMANIASEKGQDAVGAIRFSLGVATGLQLLGWRTVAQVKRVGRVDRCFWPTRPEW
jgi:hypothetical protein